MVGTFHVKLNVGCGAFPLEGFLNIDADLAAAADVFVTVPPLHYDDASVSEIYAGHFLEHLDRMQAAEFLDECYRVLEPLGKLGIVVPDTREVMRRYILGEPAPMEFPQGHHRDLRDLDELCDVVLFSTAQQSHHLWAYDARTLQRTLEAAGFRIVGEIDRYADPRLSTPQWYQLGFDAEKPS